MVVWREGYSTVWMLAAGLVGGLLALFCSRSWYFGSEMKVRVSWGGEEIFYFFKKLWPLFIDLILISA